MDGAAPLVVGIDTLAGGTVSGDVGDVDRSSTDPRVLSCQLVIETVSSHIVTNSQPLGQGSGPARPAECKARPNVSPMRMVSETKTAAAHSRPEEGSTVPHLEACPRPRTYSRLGGKM